PAGIWLNHSADHQHQQAVHRWHAEGGKWQHFSGNARTGLVGLDGYGVAGSRFCGQTEAQGETAEFESSLITTTKDLMGSRLPRRFFGYGYAFSNRRSAFKSSN